MKYPLLAAASAAGVLLLRNADAQSPQRGMICWGWIPDPTVCGSIRSDVEYVYAMMLLRDPSTEWDAIERQMPAHIVLDADPLFSKYACHVIPEPVPECKP
jgi:hypothetical protein